MIAEDLMRFSETTGLKCPFPGLRPFDFHENELFFGRDGQSEELLIKLTKTHFLAVVGGSGSGKSSLVRAGLMPALYGGLMGKAGSGWHMAILRPGNDPMGNLARALNEPDVLTLGHDESRTIQTHVNLRRGSLGLVETVRQARFEPHENLLIIVDQFEELFRFSRISEDEAYANNAAAFVKLLLEAKRESNIYVVLTMRSDYLGDCARFWDLPEAINVGQYLIPRMTREERREAIIGPLGVRGVEITPALVNQLLNAMGEDPGQLPILQHALMRSWNEWRKEGDVSRPLDLNHYETTGGMIETLSRHADEAYSELPEGGSRTIAERLFKSLTEKGLDDKETRRPSELKEICLITGTTKKEVIAVIDIFRREGRSFLMPPQDVRLKSDSSIDISHESLINGWQRLKQWVEEEANSARIYRRLVEYAKSSHAHRSGELRDPWLQETLDWRDKNNPNRAWASRHHKRFYDPPNPAKKVKKALDKEIFTLAIAFLDESKKARDRRKEAEERQRRMKLRRTRQFASVVTLASIIIFVLGGSLWRSSNRTLETSKTIRLLNYRTIMNLAQKAYEERKFGDANNILNDFLDSNQEDLRGLDWYYLWQALHNELGTLSGHSAKVTSVAFSPDDKIIATGSEDQTVRLWKADTRQPLAVLKGHQAAVLSVAFASDGTTLATGSADGTVTLWNIAGEQSARLRDLLDNQKGKKAVAVRALAFEKNGNKLVIGTEDGSVRLCDTTMSPENCLQSKFAEPNPQFDTSKGQNSQVYISSVAFSPDGKAIVSGSADGKVNLWNTSTRKPIELKPNHKEADPLPASSNSNAVLSVAFSPDGKTIAAGGQDGHIRLWDSDSRVERPFLNGRPIGAAVLTLAFSDMQTLLSGNSDGTLKLWDIRKRNELTFNGHSGAISSVSISNGKTIVTGSDDTTARVWDVKALQDSIRLEGRPGQGGIESIANIAVPEKPGVISIAFSPKSEDKIIASGSSDGTLKLWDVSKKQELAFLQGHTKPILAVAFSPDGQLIATGSADHTIKLSNIASRESRTLTGHQGRVTSVAFTPNGQTLATGSEDGTVKLWDVSTGKELKTLNGHSGKEVWSVAFSNDGKFLASGSADMTIRVWNASTGEPEKTLTGHSNGILSLTFSRDSKRLASGSADTTAAVWDVNAGFTLLAILTGHKNAVLSVAFSPDGARLVTGCFDGSVKFWDTGTSSWESVGRQELATLRSGVGDGQHLVALWSLAFSPDGKMIATGRGDFSIEFWRAATDEQIRMQR